MKQTMLVAVASAAIGAGTAAFLTNRPATPVRSAAPVRLNEAALEGAFVRALETMGFGRQARSRPVARPAEGTGNRSPAEADDTSTPVRRTAVAGSLPAANVAVIRTLGSFEKDEKLRRAWMFRSEREVIDWLGTPDRAWLGAGGESWTYKL
ncbi:MAG: hypothetical protein ACYS6Z_13090, partial [Planctomycetota bacterium]